MPYRSKYLNDFSGAEPKIREGLNGGSLVYSAGNAVLTSYAGVENYWSGGAQKPVLIAYQDLFGSQPFAEGALQQDWQQGVVYAETRISSYTFAGGDDTPAFGLSFYSDYNNCFKIHYRPSDTLPYVQLQKHISGSQSEVALDDSVVDPNTTPMRFRIYVNFRGRDMGTNLGDILSSGHCRYYYSEDDGVTWQAMAGSTSYETVVWEQAAFGLYIMRSDHPTTQDCVVNFDYLNVYEQSPDNFIKFYIQWSGGQWAAFEDAVPIMTGGGPHKWSDHLLTEGRGVGQRVPGPANAAIAEINRIDNTTQNSGPWDQGYFEDRLWLLTAGGDTFYRGWPEGVGNGIRLPQAVGFDGQGLQGWHGYRRSAAAIEDDLYIEIDAQADYQDGVNDGDGNELLSAYNAYRCVRHITLDEAWHTPVSGNGFCGASKEGKWHYDGIECGVGPFTDATKVLGQHWTMQRGDGPWASYGSASIPITIPAVGEVNFDSIGTVSGGHSAVLGTWGRWQLMDDFDIMVEFKDFAGTSPGSGGLYFDVRFDANNRVYIQRESSDLYRTASKNNGTWVTSLTAATSDTEGKLRITRTGTSIRTYRWVGSDWTQLGGPWTWTIGAVPLMVYCGMYLADRDSEGTMFGFSITAGETNNFCGWARETPAGHRGARVDFPTECAIVATQTSVEIIDTETDKLWMRFLEDSQHAIHTWGTSAKPWSMKFKEGILMIAGYTGGGCHIIDFTIDTIWNLRTEASSWTGSRYRGYSGVANTPDNGTGLNNTNGQIAQRNQNRGFAGDNNQWQIPSVNVSYCDFEFGGEYVYYATCTDAGVGVHKWRRWWFSDAATSDSLTYPDYAWTTEATDMQWAYYEPATMDLFYADTDYIYSVSSAVLENRLIGFPSRVFDYTHRLALPVPITKQSQRLMFYFNSSVYLCTDYGIYQVPWPGGPATMLYSKVGYGGTYAILPNFYTRINAIARSKDGTNELLLVDLYDEARELAQVVAINLTTHAVWAKTPIQRGGRVAGGLDG